MHMKLSEQCGIAASKGNKRIGLIKTHNIQGKKLIIPLYKAIVRSHLEYCNKRGDHRKKDIDSLEPYRGEQHIPELRDLE